MTDPAEIAARLTPAHIRALRDPQKATARAFFSICNFEDDHLDGAALFDSLTGETLPTPLGRAVLAALDAKEAGNG